MRSKTIFNDSYTIFDNGTIMNNNTGNYLQPKQTKPYSITLQTDEGRKCLSFPKLMYTSFRSLEDNEIVSFIKEDIPNKFAIDNLLSTDINIHLLMISPKFKFGKYIYQLETFYDIPEFKGYKISKGGRVLSFLINLRNKDIHIIKPRGIDKGFDLSKLDGSKTKTYYLNNLMKNTFK